jgi:hypothetical protein
VSTCLFLLDRQSGRFVALETREQSLYRPHGFEAARRLGLTHRYSYGPHWFDDPELRKLIWTVRGLSDSALAEVSGGLDIDGGSWLTFHHSSGIYCRMLTEMPAHRSAMLQHRAVTVSPSGLPVECATGDSARTAAELLTEQLVPALENSGQIMAGFRLLIADQRDVYVVTFDGRDAVTIEVVTDDRPRILTTSGSADQLAKRIESITAPTGNLYSWGPWLSACAADDLDLPIFRPPFRTSPAEPDDIAWTKSVSIYSADRTGTEFFAYNERQLFDDQPVPTDIHRMGFPATPDHFYVVIARADA